MTMNKIITFVYKNCFYFAINNVLINAMWLCLCNNTLLTQSMDIQTHTYTRSNCSVTKRTERPLRNSTIKTVHLARLFENFNCTNYLLEYIFLLNFFGISFVFYLKFREKYQRIIRTRMLKWWNFFINWWNIWCGEFSNELVKQKYCVSEPIKFSERDGNTVRRR